MAPLAYLIYLETALALVQAMCLSQLWSLREVNKVDSWEKRQEMKWTFGKARKCYRDNVGSLTSVIIAVHLISTLTNHMYMCCKTQL